MKKLVLAAMLLVLLAVAAFYGVRMMAPPPGDLDLSRAKPSANGLYEVTVMPESEPLEQGAMHAWIMEVTLPDGTPIEDAKIAIDGGMPQHGHGLPTAPRATAHQGGGRYRLDGVRFNMGGWWVLELDIDASAGRDSVEFNIVL